MSKSKKNYPDPNLLIDKYGVDSLRLYLMSSVVMKADNLSFSESAVDDIRKNVMNIWWNIFAFAKMVGVDSDEVKNLPSHHLDRWLLSKIENLTASVTTFMDNYDVVSSTRSLMSFAKEFSTWYLRLSRDRLRTSKESQAVLGYALKRYSLLMAPFAPFMAERIYQNLPGANDSVHLELWPAANAAWQNNDLEASMETVMSVVEKGHAARKLGNIRLRQPLPQLYYPDYLNLSSELREIIRDELNVKEVGPSPSPSPSVGPDTDIFIELDTNLTPNLIAEGMARDLMRDIQGARKALGLSINSLVSVSLPSWPVDFEEEIKKKVNAKELVKGEVFKVTPL